ncbi:MAG: extracellular solute-binding protein [Clostridiales bacterium]|nr:extracellular solute-binding protein [Clostridiales bacterium]
MLNLVKNSTRSVWQHKSKIFIMMIIALVFLSGMEFNTVVLGEEQQPTYSAYKNSYSQFINEKAEEIVLPADNYKQATGTENLNNAVLSGKDSIITYAFNISEPGLFYIMVSYKAVAGGSEIARGIRINSEFPFEEAKHITFKRFYRDQDQEYKKEKGNQTFPPQIETEIWYDYVLSDSKGEPFEFFFDAGENLLTLEYVDGEIWIDKIRIVPVVRLLDYKSYVSQLFENGYDFYRGKPIKIQAEDAVLKSSPSLYPVNDRTSPLSEPYHPYYVVLNTIGGYAWRFPGQTIIWEIDIPEEGLYKIAFRYKQSYNRGRFSLRKLTINGKIPFAEVSEIKFPYDTKFNLKYLADESTGEEYSFYLEKGKNTIGLEVCLGVFGQLIEQVENSLRELNRIYQDIVIVTGTSPDRYRDYNLTVLIPDLRGRLISQRDNLKKIIDEMSSTTGGFTDSNSIIEMLIITIDKIIQRPNEIGRYLGDFKNYISSLGYWIDSMIQQPLLLDYIIVAPADYRLPKGEANLIGSIGHRIKAFLGSFVVNFDQVLASSTQQKRGSIEVWVSTGRDQYNILRRLINESFSKRHNIDVNLRLVTPEAIIPATLTGTGPDIVIQAAASIPMNLGYRGGAYDLASFADFTEVKESFSPAALNTFVYGDSCYALPDQMSFNVMFYRTDIFDNLNISVPKTMDELLAIVPILQKNNMDIYFTTTEQPQLGAVARTGMTKNVNAVYVSFLYQMGGALYYNDGESTAIISEAGINAFKYWTELYTKHNFIVSTDFVTRFRLGEIPVGVVDLTTFNSLSVAAPEIKGQWAIALIPGIVSSDGGVKHDNPVAVSGAFIVKNIVERKGTTDLAWEYLKWWTSEEAQYEFANSMESVLGLAGRYTTANVAAFKRLGWGTENMKVLEESLQWLRTVPQVPGGYITGRLIENAFLSVVTESESRNPIDAIYDAADAIDNELDIKRKEFSSK